MIVFVPLPPTMISSPFEPVIISLPAFALILKPFVLSAKEMMSPNSVPVTLVPLIVAEPAVTYCAQSAMLKV